MWPGPPHRTKQGRQAKRAARADQPETAIPGRPEDEVVLADLSPDLLLPVEPYLASCGPSGHIFHQFVIRTRHRNALRAKLQETGIGTEIYYPLALHQQDCFRHLGYRKGDFPGAECAAEECLALPIFPELNQEEIDLVTGAIHTFFEKRHV